MTHVYNNTSNMNFLIVVNSFSDASSSSVVEDWDEECKAIEPYCM